MPDSSFRTSGCEVGRARGSGLRLPCEGTPRWRGAVRGASNRRRATTDWRSGRHVPLWGIAVWLHYAPRRVECREHGVVVEYLPWNEGKRALTTAMMVFLARWARRLSWREAAEVFQVSWDAVYRSV